MTSPSDTELAARVRAASLIGRVVSGRYRVVELLAMGGMGAVYRGEHLRMRKRVALKVLHPQIEGLPDLVARFEREAIAGAHIQHPNVASATDFGELDDGSYFLVLEYVAGETLHDVIRRDGPLPPRRAAHIARQLASGLAAAHAAGVVHRDVKPRNVMLVEGSDDHAKLIDFGLATVTAERLSAIASDPQSERAVGRLTGEGVIVGTVAYLAPEAALGMGAVDARSDLYALGVILYEMLAGQHPFDATDPVALFKQQRFQAPKPIAELAKGVTVPRELEAIAMRLMAKDPTARYASGTEVVGALDDTGLPPPPAALASQRPPSPEPPAEVTPPAAPASARASLGDRKAHRAAPARAKEAAPGRRGGTKWRGVVLATAAIAAVAAAVALSPPGTEPSSSGPSATSFAGPPPSAAPPRAAPPSAAPPAVAPPSAAPGTASGATAAGSSSAAPGDATATPAATRGDADGALRALLVKSASAGDDGTAETALLTLVDADPKAFKERPVMVAAREVATRVGREGGGDRVFDALAHRLGPDGLDVLYDIVEAKGGSAAAKRAAAILETPEATAAASPALRVAVELRTAPCAGKLALLDRAVAEGDARALVVLETLGKGCFKKSRAIEKAIKSLRARLTKEEAAATH